MYPEAAKERRIRDKLVACYSVANPKKVDEVDKIMLKYKGKERSLFIQLADKYGQYEECLS
jgi:hypothetical protein